MISLKMKAPTGAAEGTDRERQVGVAEEHPFLALGRKRTDVLIHARRGEQLPEGDQGDGKDHEAGRNSAASSRRLRECRPRRRSARC